MIEKLITVKLGDKERFDKEQIFTDYQPFYTINLLLDKCSNVVLLCPSDIS